MEAGAAFRHFDRSRFEPPAAAAKKRGPPWLSAGHHDASPRLSAPTPNWNPSTWSWDSVGFVAKPSETEQRSNEVPPPKDGEGDNLTLKLGRAAYQKVPAAAAERPSKRVRSGSPIGGGGGSGGGGGGGGGSYPMCQVDDCRKNLTAGKDYHKRHKVCEVHSKAAGAVVGKQMQRFCQQCSRFHPLSEFDEGKRSCRRRLAGHNRRRRKTQPDDTPSRSAPPNQENGPNGSADIVNLITILARLQGINASKTGNNILGGLDLNVAEVPQRDSIEQLCKANGKATAPSTNDLSAVRSTAAGASGPDIGHTNGDVTTKITHVGPSLDVISGTDHLLGDGRIGHTEQSLSEGRPPVDGQLRLSLQLFGFSEDDSPQKNGSSVKCSSSVNSGPMEDKSPQRSPPVALEFFPMQAEPERGNERMLVHREGDPAVQKSTSCGWSTPLDLFKGPERHVQNCTGGNHQSQLGYTSSGSDRSASSSNSDTDRTGRIIFKLFDKDPSNLPASLHSQILNWLSSSPSEMESYIRPGCIVLSVYASMPSMVWDELEENLLHRVTSLVQCADSELWRNARFLVRTSMQLASHKDGKIHLCKSRKTWRAPELISVSPVAVVSGHETSLVLRGRNLAVPGTKIHCTYMGGYLSKEVLGSNYPGQLSGDSSSESFNFPLGPPNVFGRYFIEVENGFKGNHFPVIIANATICQELRELESEIEKDVGIAGEPWCQVQDGDQRRSREDILHFLNELGWLFQKKPTPSSPPVMDFSCTRFKFLVTFSVERNWTTLTKTLLDLLVERSVDNEALSGESLEMILETQLLSRAVKRKCKKMVDFLLHYSVTRGSDSSKVCLFPPNLVGPGGLTPLHLAASTQDSVEMVDALTNDPQEIGLNSWDSIQDDNGQTPYAYALTRNLHSYNNLVARKLADKRNDQFSITVASEDIYSDKQCITDEQHKPSALSLQVKSCARCAMGASGFKPVVRRRGILHRPYVHSMLGIAAVCVCVCLFLRGMPDIGSVEPFKWENLDFGPS